MAPRLRISAAVLDSADPRSLATFYERLLGWTRVADEPARPGHPPEDGWVMLRPTAGGTGLSFQYEPTYQRPAWPSTPGQPQMMVHLDIGVTTLTQRSSGPANWAPPWTRTNPRTASG